jgi:adenylate cyclase
MGISTKLILMVTCLIVGAMGVVVYVATDLFREDSVTRVQETNKDVAASLSQQVFNIFKDTSSKMTLMAETVADSHEKGITPEVEAFIQNILKSNDELLSFGIYNVDPAVGYTEVFFATTNEVLAELDTRLEDLKNKPLPQIENAIAKAPESVGIVNTSPLFKKPVLTMGFLTKENPLTHSRWLLRADLRQEPLIKLFGSRAGLSAYLIDKEGNLLVHSNPQLILQRYNVSIYPIVQRFREGKIDNQEMEFEDEQGTSFLGAYKSLGVGNSAVVAQVETSKALAAITRVQYRSVLVTGIVVGIAFVLNFIFSQSMTNPLKTLFLATEKIAEGKFDFKLQVESNDEIGALTRAFKKMTIGLEERDRLKSTFSKFHSKEIAQKILSGEIKLGGERKMATVFFSDIRGFTSLSETMSPDEVLAMLNEYMTEMVKIIYKHGGVVDKYVGDAIMALWGVPNAGASDAFNAVSAALEMRKALKEFNRRRRSRNQSEIKIGIGIHTGEVVAGNMGSNERLEYTVIGDNVNQASRIESANKDYGSDILISDATSALVQNRAVVGPAFSIHVKGKISDLNVHQLVGLKTAEGIQTDLNQAQQSEMLASAPMKIECADLDENTSASLMAGPRVQASEKPEKVPATFYLLRTSQSQDPEGPFTASQLKVISSQAGFQFDDAYAFREGDSQTTPLAQVPGLSRRVGGPQKGISVPPPPEEMIMKAQADEWFLYGDESTTYGPYTVTQLQQGILGGNITRTSYVWRQGFEKWIYVYQVPGFDRRTEAPSFEPVSTGSDEATQMGALPHFPKKLG